MYAQRNPYGQGYLEHNPPGSTGLLLGLGIAGLAALGIGMNAANAAVLKPEILPRPKNGDGDSEPQPDEAPVDVTAADLKGVWDGGGSLGDVPLLRDRATLPLAFTTLDRDTPGVPNAQTFPLITRTMPPLAMSLRPEALNRVQQEIDGGATGGLNALIANLDGALPLQYLAATADGTVSMQLDTDELLAAGVGIPSEQLAPDIVVANGTPVTAVQQVMNLKSYLDPELARQVADMAQHYVVNKNFVLDEPGPTRDQFILDTLASLVQIEADWTWADVLAGRVDNELLRDVVRGVSLIGQIVYQSEINRQSMGG